MWLKRTLFSLILLLVLAPAGWTEEPEGAAFEEVEFAKIERTISKEPDTLCYLSDQFLIPGKDRIFATVIAKDREGRIIETRSEIKEKPC